MLQEIWSFSGLASKIHLTVKISSEKWHRNIDQIQLQQLFHGPNAVPFYMNLHFDSLQHKFYFHSDGLMFWLWFWIKVTLSLSRSDC